MNQKELLEKVQYILKTDAENTKAISIAEEIVFMEQWPRRKTLIVTNKKDTCYPFIFYIGERKWSFSTRNLKTINGDSIYISGSDDYDPITLEEAKVIIGDNLPDEKLLDDLDKYFEKQKKIILAEEWKPTTIIKETRIPTGELISINKDNTKITQPYGETIETEYECPCGKGKIVATFENIPGYRDSYAFIKCGECDKKYRADYNWARNSVPILKEIN